MNFKPLVIGELIAKIPIIQGGMGVGVSLSSLASAVTLEGGIGVISTAQIGYDDPLFQVNPLQANLKALRHHIELAKEKALGGIIGVNIMTVTKKYEEYVFEAIKSKVDLIISGAGLPLNLPELVKNSKTKIAPIVSSLKATKVLLKMWDNRYKATADLIIVEGPKAGGHLGFKLDYLEDPTNNFDEELKSIIEFKEVYEKKYEKHIPVVFGGGVYTKEDINYYLSLGCNGVQIASRFVATVECDANINFKEAYVNCKEGDITIIKSPVGMPGRAILNDFVKRTLIENEKIVKCYDCLSHCDRVTIPYCITNSLINSVKGDVKNSLVFCGSNTYKIDKITTVKELFKEFCS